MKLILRSFVGFACVMCGALLVIAVFDRAEDLLGKDSPANIKVENTPVDRDAKLGTSFAPVIKKVVPSVVNIYTTRYVKERSQGNPLFNDPLFRQFFGEQVPDGEEQTRREMSLGSGVVVSPDGYILTANHVVEGADEIKVRTADNKKQFTARLVGRDRATDVAVIKIESTDLPAVTLADSDQLEVGDVVLAIGNPFNVGQTVTMGIVSAVGRGGIGLNRYENFIQTDAAINPGNSGGALVDAEGRLIGINDAIRTETGGYQGIGYAVPINMARSIMERLISGKPITRGYLGITMQDIGADLAQQFNLPDQNGVLVDDVLPGTPAARAGIQSGDVITGLNGKPVADGRTLQLAVSEADPGSKVNVKLIRDGAIKIVVVTLAELPGAMAQNDNDQGDNQADNKTDALEGVTVADLDSQIRDQLKVPDSVQGAIVANVDQDSNSAEAGLLVNDIIVEINRQPVTDSDDAVRLCKAAKGDQILVKVWRRTNNFVTTRYLSVDNTARAK
jgi:serine protease Do